MKAPTPQLLILAGGLPTTTEAFGEWQNWTTTETRHVLRGDRPESAPSVRLAAACNEWESFQIDRYQVNALGIPRLTTAVKDPEWEKDPALYQVAPVRLAAAILALKTGGH